MHKRCLEHLDGVPPENLEEHRWHLGCQWSLSSFLILKELTSNFQSQLAAVQIQENIIKIQKFVLGCRVVSSHFNENSKTRNLSGSRNQNHFRLLLDLFTIDFLETLPCGENVFVFSDLKKSFN